MNDWYTEGVAMLTTEAAEAGGCTYDQAAMVYAFLSEIGLIDYDVEKDVIRERYEDEE